jgi:cell division transport system ATP-binding protein
MTEIYCGDVPILSLKHVSRRYPGAVSLLTDVDFDHWPGEFVYITGPSGSGKTTLLKLIYRAAVPESGRIFFCGKDITDLSPSSVPYLRRNMGIVFQDFNLIDWMTVEENIAVPLEILGFDAEEIRERTSSILAKMGLKGYEKQYVGKLSGGEQQRVASARAAVSRPPVLLADEPTGNLDQLSASAIIDLLEQFGKEGSAVIVATHDELLLASRPHRTMAIMGGRLVEVDYENSVRHRKVIEAMEAA